MRAVMVEEGGGEVVKVVMFGTEGAVDMEGCGGPASILAHRICTTKRGSLPTPSHSRALKPIIDLS